ncbi:MAG: LptA/OstA family protein [Vicinamibacterales bacterium]
MWRKRLRFAVAVFGLALIGVVAYTVRPREQRAAPPPIAQLDPKAIIQTIGGDVIQLKGTRQDLRVEFKGQLTYPDGQTRLTGVKINVDNRGGRNFVVSGDQAQIGTDKSSFDIAGHVKLEASDGLVAYSEKASYTEAEKIVRAPGPVKFSSGRMSGTGIGFTFDEQRNTLWLLDQAKVDFAAEGNAGAMNVTAGAAGYARTDRYMRFERGVHLLRDGQVIDAAEAMAYLFPDRDETDRIELRGNANITGGAGMGSLRSMVARDLNLDYREDGRTLEKATLAGQAAIQLAASDGTAGQRLAGEFMDLSFALDGSLSSLVSRDAVVVTLPATRNTAARTIRSTGLAATGAEGQGLTAMTFDEGVEYREAATREHGPRSAKSRKLEAKMAPGSGALLEAVFTGGFTFEDGPMRARSDESRYQITEGRLVLSGKPKATPPQITDDAVTIDAESIDVTLSPRKMIATGNVKSLLQPTKKGAAASTAKRPGLLGEKDPVNVMADALTYEEESRKGVYTGKARLFQGDTTIQGNAIALDETRGDLSATGAVQTSLVIGDAAAPAGSKPASTLVQAGSFVYSDQTRQAVYETLVHMNGAQGDLRAGKLALFLDKEQNTLLRLEANGLVSATVDKRLTTGTSLNYQAADEKYVMQGTPVKMIDADCQETTGKTLTFFKSSARVIVDGNEEVRTQTKGGGKCPQTPPD